MSMALFQLVEHSCPLGKKVSTHLTRLPETLTRIRMITHTRHQTEIYPCDRVSNLPLEALLERCRLH